MRIRGRLEKLEAVAPDKGPWSNSPRRRETLEHGFTRYGIEEHLPEVMSIDYWYAGICLLIAYRHKVEGTHPGCWEEGELDLAIQSDFDELHRAYEQCQQEVSYDH